jgi:hypothetical protein
VGRIGTIKKQPITLLSKVKKFHLEKGDRIGTAKILLAIAKVLKIDLEDLT